MPFDGVEGRRSEGARVDHRAGEPPSSANSYPPGGSHGASNVDEDGSIPNSGLIVLGLLFAAFAFCGSGLEASLWGIGLAASALPVYAISRSRHGPGPALGAIRAAPPVS